jgi:DNA-binding cell septation regulator SpoVG
MNANTITVLKIKTLGGSGPLKAYVDVQLDDWTIFDFRIIKQDRQRAWVSPPQFSWRDASGASVYRAVMTIPAEDKQRIEVAILHAWEKETSNGTPALFT